jgi:hypothetical protein
VNFYEKALFVKAAVAATVSECNGLRPSRYASIRTFGEPTLRWLGAWDEIRLNSGSTKALQSSERSSLEGGPSSQWRSHLMLDPKRIRASGRALRLFRVLALADHHLLFSSYSAPSFFSLSRYTFAPVRVVERFVDLSTNP